MSFFGRFFGRGNKPSRKPEPAYEVTSSGGGEFSAYRGDSEDPWMDHAGGQEDFGDPNAMEENWGYTIVCASDSGNYDPAMHIFDAATIAAMLAAGQTMKLGSADEIAWSGNDEVIKVIGPYWGAEIPNLTAIADEGAGPVNAWLEEHGVDITLQDQGPGLYMAAVQSATMFWPQVGTSIKIALPSTGEYVDGFALEGEWVEILDDMGVPFARIATTDGFHVYIQKLEDDEELGGIEIVGRAHELVTAAKLGLKSRFKGVHLPCIDYAGGCKLTALLGMKLGALEIREALTALVLKMNRFGAADKVASAVAALESMGPEPLVVDGRFLYFRTAPGSDLPLVTAVIPESGFKDPGDDAVAV